MRKEYVLILLLALSILVSGKTLHVTFGVTNSSEIYVLNMEYNEQGEQTRHSLGGSYKIEIRDSSETVLSEYGFEPYFIVFVDPGGAIPVELEVIMIDLKYYSTSKYLVFTYRNDELLRIDLSQYSTECDSDGYCDYDENVIFCSNDCSVDSDSICTAFMDNTCDEDCSMNEDIDCIPGAKKPRTFKEIHDEYMKEKDKEKMTSTIFWFLVILAIIGLIFAYYKAKISKGKGKRRW